MMLRVIDSTPLCLHDHPQILRPVSVVSSKGMVVVHRISLARKTTANPEPIVDAELDGPELARRFRNKGLGTGGRTPYTALARQDLALEQLLPLVVKGTHAIDHNWCSWSLAVAGNSDEEPIPEELYEVMLEALAVLAVVPRKVSGHTELPGSSGDPNKRCPGRYVNMDHVRAEVEKRLPVGSDTWDLPRRLKYIARAGFSI
jgi:hypothetical protein